MERLGLAAPEGVAGSARSKKTESTTLTDESKTPVLYETHEFWPNLGVQSVVRGRGWARQCLSVAAGRQLEEYVTLLARGGLPRIEGFSAIFHQTEGRDCSSWPASEYGNPRIRCRLEERGCGGRNVRRFGPLRIVPTHVPGKTGNAATRHRRPHAPLDRPHTFSCCQVPARRRGHGQG